MAKISRNQARVKKHLRIRRKLMANSTLPRLVVFKSLKNLEAQLIDDSKNKTILFTSTSKLKLEKTGNKDAAIAAGKDIGAKIKAAGIKSIVFDRSGYIYHGKIQAFADAVRKEGVKF